MQVYLDHNATTPPAPAVVDAMLPFLRERWANPASLHRAGASLRRDLDAARRQTAGLLGADPAEIVFTSGATESNNQAIAGAWEAAGRALRIITTTVEHPSVRNPCHHLRDLGATVVEIPVDRGGALDLEALRRALAAGPALVTIMAANNETGVIFPLAEIAAATQAAGALMHTDAVQMAGRLPIDLRALRVDLLSLSAHKFGGPKGVGALFRRRGTRLEPLLRGGAQEGGLRGGTANVPGIVGMGLACALAQEHLGAMGTRVRALRDQLEAGLLARCPDAIVHGAGNRLPNTLNIRFGGVEGESLLYRLDDAGIAASSGAACSSGTMAPSAVLLAMGVPAPEAARAIRFSLGRENTAAEIAYTIEQTASLVATLRRRR